MMNGVFGACGGGDKDKGGMGERGKSKSKT